MFDPNEDESDELTDQQEAHSTSHSTASGEGVQRMGRSGELANMAVATCAPLAARDALSFWHDRASCTLRVCIARPFIFTLNIGQSQPTSTPGPCAAVVYQSRRRRSGSRTASCVA
jgi:hypothetical protein